MSQKLELLLHENERLMQELTCERERNTKLMQIIKEAKRLVTTQTRKAGVDHFRQLLKDAGLHFE